MRTILSITQESGSPDAFLQLEDTTINIAGDWNALRVDKALTQPPDWDTPGAVRERGRKLREFLAHEASLNSLLIAIDALAPGSHQLYFRHRGAAAESIDWETLYEQRGANGQFLALSRCPIGRVTRLPLRNSGPHTIPKPLRLMAIISALGESGVSEYQALRELVADATASGKEIVLQVLTGEPAILDAPDVDGAVVRPLPGVPGDARALQQAVGEFDPHVLHFFAHGVAEEGSGKKWLEFGLRPDWENGEAIGSLQLHEEQLANVLQARSTWLVVLNCCNGGRAVETGPLARRLVEEAKLAAVIGMVAPVEPGDATLFTKGFYPGLFDAVQGLLDGATGSIDWAELLVKPRREILDANGGLADNVRSWALPVVYALSAPYTPLWYALTLPQLRQLEIARDAVAGSTNLGPRRTREMIRQLLEGSIDERYWPDVNGRLPEGVL